jgi:hypothetical protein
MTRLEALKDLKAKVEADAEYGDDWINLADFLWPDLQSDRRKSDGTNIVGTIIKAKEGSLDAALLLHEVVLPGWKYEMWGGYEGGTGGAAVYQSVLSITTAQAATGPARAWLLVILSALIEQEKKE